MKPNLLQNLRVIAGTDYINGQQQPVFQFQSDNIRIQIPDKVQKGNYCIGVIDGDWFIVKYVGRATDQTLTNRLLQHKNHTDDHYYDDNHYFFFSPAKTDGEAIRQECIDYHSFGKDEFLDNKVHPALPNEEACPFPGCDHVGG